MQFKWPTRPTATKAQGPVSAEATQADIFTAKAILSFVIARPAAAPRRAPGRGLGARADMEGRVGCRKHACTRPPSAPDARVLRPRPAAAVCLRPRCSSGLARPPTGGSPEAPPRPRPARSSRHGGVVSTPAPDHHRRPTPAWRDPAPPLPNVRARAAPRRVAPPDVRC